MPLGLGPVGALKLGGSMLGGGVVNRRGDGAVPGLPE